MLFALFIVAVVRNPDLSLRVTLATLDESFSVQVTLPAAQAQEAYIGRPVFMKVDYNPIP